MKGIEIPKEKTLKKRIFDSYLLTACLASMVVSLFFFGRGFWLYHHPNEILPFTTSVAELELLVNGRVSIPTEFITYTDVNLNFFHDDIRAYHSSWFGRRESSGRDSLYLVTFEDGIVAMRGAHQFSENFTLTHDQLNGWVSLYRNDNITQRLIERYTSTEETTISSETELSNVTVVVSFLSSEQDFDWLDATNYGFGFLFFALLLFITHLVVKKLRNRTNHA